MSSPSTLMIRVRILLAAKFVWKDENKWKRGRGWPIYKKPLSLKQYECLLFTRWVIVIISRACLKSKLKKTTPLCRQSSATKSHRRIWTCDFPLCNWNAWDLPKKFRSEIPFLELHVDNLEWQSHYEIYVSPGSDFKSVNLGGWTKLWWRWTKRCP